MVAKKIENGVSLKVSEMVEGGGGLFASEGADGVITDIKFATCDYNNTVNPPVPAIMVTIEDRDGLQYQEYLKIANPDEFMPSPDGTRLIQVGSKTSIRDDTNAALFLASLDNSGFPEDKVEDDITCYKGLDAHFIRVPEPKSRKSMKRAPRADGREFEKTILTVDEIHKYPWETTKKGKTVKASANTSVDSDLGKKAVDTLINLLTENGGEIMKKDLAGLVFRALDGDNDRVAIVKMLNDDEVLSNCPVCNYKNGTLTL